YFLPCTSCLSAVRFAKEGSVWLGGLIMLERCTENLRTRFRVTDALFHKKLLERVAIFHIKRPLDLLGSAAGDAIRDRLERLVPIDPPNDCHLLAIARPLRRKRIASSVEELLDLLERSDLFAGGRVGQVKMEMLIAKLAAAVGGDGNLSIGRYTLRDRDVLIRPILIVPRRPNRDNRQ